MPVIEMRESLGPMEVDFTDATGAIVREVVVVQKRINLKEGTWQRNMLQMDLFFDDYPHEVGPRVNPFVGIIEVYVTPTPIILTNERLSDTLNAGPYASNPNVLYKATLDQDKIRRFPQDFLATNANFPFFHDQLFLTMIFHRNLNEGPEKARFAASFYLSYKEKKVPAYRAAMGVVSEKFNSMIAQLQSNGRDLPNVTDLAGSYIPSFNWGGIRPEFMVDAAALSFTQFFLPLNPEASETMSNTGVLRIFAAQAREMVPNPDAFGSVGGGAGNIPDWFRSLLPKGVEAGPVRPQFPPRVTQDDPTLGGLGNILMV